jgi:hypothetical protein
MGKPKTMCHSLQLPRGNFRRFFRSFGALKPRCDRGRNHPAGMIDGRRRTRCTVVRADTFADAAAMPEVTSMVGSRNQIVCPRIQTHVWRVKVPLAQPLLQ